MKAGKLSMSQTWGTNDSTTMVMFNILPSQNGVDNFDPRPTVEVLRMQVGVTASYLLLIALAARFWTRLILGRNIVASWICFFGGRRRRKQKKEETITSWHSQTRIWSRSVPNARLSCFPSSWVTSSVYPMAYSNSFVGSVRSV